jgi:cytochrome c5
MINRSAYSKILISTEVTYLKIDNFSTENVQFPLKTCRLVLLKKHFNIMKSYKVSFLIILSVTITSCGLLQIGVKKTAEPEPLTMEDIKKRFPGYTLTEYNAGESLYQVNCGKCHGLYKAGSLTEGKWASTIPRMAVKVNKKAGRDLISKAGEQAIYRYLYSQGMKKIE